MPPLRKIFSACHLSTNAQHLLIELFYLAGAFFPHQFMSNLSHAGVNETKIREHYIKKNISAHRCTQRERYR
jgi:hypothetical protein